MATEKTTLRVAPVENADLLFEEAATIEWANRRWAVIRSEGQFHLRLAQFHEGYGYDLHAGKAHGELYRPIHPDMTRDDVEGATYAHDDGTHWLFAHCSPEEQIDLAADVRTFSINQFQTAINRAQIKVHEATNQRTKATAFAKLKALVKFARAVGSHCYETVTGQTLGYYHRNPWKDHWRDMTAVAISAVLAEWKKEALTDTAVRAERAHVTTDAGTVYALMKSTHTIEWRHVRAARLEAERKKSEAADES